MPISTLLVVAGPIGELAGTLHLPDRTPIATVLMVPGSGPSDRDNDVFFPPIRAGLLAGGIAAASFDKRGVGGSAGDWRDTGPREQGADVAAQLVALRAVPEIAATPLGLFGHSQGGWVVLEVAAADPAVAFVITSSGPGVTPAAQERHALGAKLAVEGVAPADVAGALARYDGLVDVARAGAGRAALDAVVAAPSPVPLAGHVFVPADDAELELMRRWLDHDPRAALERIRCPVLAVFGADDPIVPVEASVAVFRGARAGRPGGLEVTVLAGADHRLRVAGGGVHSAYLDRLAAWIEAVATA
jgi:uncharacterized protein